MGSQAAIIAISDEELQVRWVASGSGIGRLGRNNVTTVDYDCVSLEPGVVDQGRLGNPQALTGKLGELCRRHAAKGEQCIPAYLILSTQQGFVRAFDLPWIEPQDRGSTVEFLVDEEVPITEQVLYDWLTLKEDPEANYWRVLVGVGKRQLVEDFAQALLAGGFQVKGVDFRDTALGCALGGVQEVLYLRSSSVGIYLAVFAGTSPELVRNWSSGHLAGISEEEQFAEIWRLIRYLGQARRSLVFDQIVVSGEPKARVLGEKLLELGVAPGLKYDEGIPPELSRWLPAGQKRTLGLDVWRRVKEQQKSKKAWRLALGLTCAGILTGVILSLFWWQTEVRLEAEVAILAERGAGLELRQREQQELEQAWAALTLNSTSTGSMLAGLSELERYGTELVKLEYANGRIQLHGEAEQSEAVKEFLMALPGSGWSEPALTMYRQNGSEHIEFALTAQREE